jgi:outer membrane receptor for ferric coprogen and ferric-rhodotorulic acid
MYTQSDSAVKLAPKYARIMKPYNFDIAPHVLGYASVGTGYHPGRVEDGGTHDDPETLTNYEIGEKSTLFGGRVTANLAAYYEDLATRNRSRLQRSTADRPTDQAGTPGRKSA